MTMDISRRHDIGGTFNGPLSIVSFDMMSSGDGASSCTAPRDILFSQRVPFQPAPKPHSRPQQRSASPDLVDCPTDAAAKTELNKNQCMRLMHEQGWGMHDAYSWATVQTSTQPFRKQLIPDAFAVPQLPSPDYKGERCISGSRFSEDS